MIRAICLNPVVDRMYHIDDFSAARQFKEIAPRIYAGGKGVNIARVVAQLGEEVVLYAFLGGVNGEIVRKDMQGNGVQIIGFPMPGETRTTINIIDGKNRRETEITEPSCPVDLAQAQALLAHLERDIYPGDIVVCSGIPGKGMQSGIYRVISDLCQRLGARCALDTNSRYLSESFPGRYFFMKPNIQEILELHGGSASGDAREMVRLGRSTLAMGVDSLIISTGKDGGMLVSADTVMAATVPPVRVVSTIGSGDSTVAGYCVAASRGLDAESSLRLAMACGVSNATFDEVGFVDAGQVADISREIRITRIDA